jgi:hypothetical protein
MTRRGHAMFGRRRLHKRRRIERMIWIRGTLFKSILINRSG